MALFNFKKSFLKSGLLAGMTDIHSHILPDVDDGMKSYNEAVKSLRWLKENGVRQLYLTPHIMSDFSKNHPDYLTGQFQAFTERLKNDGEEEIPALKLAGEYMLEVAFIKQRNEGLLTFADRHVLVETSYMSPPMGFIRYLEDLTDDGYTPVLAHPERYIYMDEADYKTLYERQVAFQLNYLSVTGAYGRRAKEKAFALLNKGFYTYVGSDFHRLVRHEKDYQTRFLTQKQINTLHTLFDNNKQLW